MGLRSPPAKTYQKTWSLRNQTSRWLRTSESVVPTVHLSSDQDDSQHPFGNQATTRCKFVALGFASQPFDWFAFSRMMTLQARLTRNYASAHVGQASHLTLDKWCQAKSLTYGSEDEFRAARDLSIACPGPTSVRHASTQTYVNSLRSQTKDLRQFRNIP
jgi:hypothetical protein